MAVAFTRSETPGTEEATLFYSDVRDADTLSIKEDGIRATESRSHALFAWETRSLVRRRILQVVIGALGVAIIVMIILAFKLNASDAKFSYLDKARFNSKDKHIDFRNAAGKFVLSAEIGLNLSSELMERHSQSSSRSKYITADGVTLVLSQETEYSLTVNWTSSSKKPIVFMDCFYLLTYKAHWYGGSEMLAQKWPMEEQMVSMAQYVPQSTRGSQGKVTFGSVLERYWLNSLGIALLVDTAVPLHVSINANGNGKLCLKSDTTGSLQPAVSYLGYRVLSGYNPRDLHLRVIDEFLGKPTAIPNNNLIEKPTWIIGNDSDNVSQKDIQNMWEKLSLFNLPCANIIVAGQYSEKKGVNTFGQLNVDTNSVVPLSQGKLIGCNVSLKVHPYLQINSKMFSVAMKAGYLLEDCGGKVPGLINWRNSLAACIDVTRISSNTWFEKQLENFRQMFGFDSFEFHGGEVTHLPWCYRFYNKNMDPGHYSTEYAKFATSTRGLNVHVGYRTQKLPIFLKMSSKDSTWDGLKAVIPTVLTYGIMGYPYVLPSVIGFRHGGVDEELYVRWIQANAFLPGIQFNRPPWDISNETKEIVKNVLEKRSRLSAIIMDAFVNVTKTGAPVIRPIWWIAPKDPVALKIDDQFLLGDKYLVAPILKKDESIKIVYLPPSCIWKEEFTEQQMNESVSIKQQKGEFYTDKGQFLKYQVNLTSLLFFKFRSCDSL